MIRINREGYNAPQHLIDDGQNDLPRIEALVHQDKLTSNDFKKNIYSSEEVRNALWEMQHHKCCYCEHKYERSWSTVEHFRPKTSVKRENKSVKPGYWWLAYDFKNLYFACQNCNNPKDDYFPIEPESEPLQPMQHPSTHHEAALILDPGKEHPEEHLTFKWIHGRGFQIASLNGSKKGRETIAATQLDRDDLSKLRMDYYEDYIVPVIERYMDAIDNDNQQGKEQAINDAQRMTTSKYEYSLLAKIAFKQAGML